MNTIPRPKITPNTAFDLLKLNGFDDLDLADGATVAIEPGMENTKEYMLCFVPNGKFLETYGVHAGGKRWTWVA
jgi:hypothetical protein